MSHRHYLTIVRARDRSLCPTRLAGAGSRPRNIVVSHSGANPDRFRAPDVIRIDSQTPKRRPLRALLWAHPELTARHDFIFPPGDGLTTDMESIDHLFVTCTALAFEAAQPSLTRDSASTHLATLWHDDTLLRFTNYVEFMAPCLSSAKLAGALPLFADSVSGRGTDFNRSKPARDAERRIGVLDAVTVRHSRPIGRPNGRGLQKCGQSPVVALRAFCQRHDIDPKIVTHHALSRYGKPVTGDRRERMFDSRMRAGRVAAMRRSPGRGRVVGRMGKRVARTVTEAPCRLVDLNATSL